MNAYGLFFHSENLKPLKVLHMFLLLCVAETQISFIKLNYLPFLLVNRSKPPTRNCCYFYYRAMNLAHSLSFLVHVLFLDLVRNKIEQTSKYILPQ